MNKKIDVEFWEVPRQNICFGAVKIEIVLEVTTQLVYNFVTYYGAEITEASESVVVVVQGVNETLDFS
jgi:hypothetical protein